MQKTHSTGRAKARVSLARRAVLLMCASCAMSGAWAQDYPSRPIKLVVPFPPGGSVDTVARALAPQLQAQLGQPVVIENRAGANSVLGAQSVKRAPADGYTILLNASLQVVNPLIMTTTTYDPEKDFKPITYLGALPQLVLVSSASRYTDLQSLLADARKRPGEVQWATAAYGAGGHLAAELLKVKAKVDMPMIPYKGGAPALNDLMGMQVAAMIEPMASAYPQVKGGRLRALAVTTPKRLPGLPDLPTVAESGFPGFDMPSWYGVWAPAGTPQEIVDKLNAEIRTAMQAPAVASKLSSMFFQPVLSSPSEFAAFVAKELAMDKEIVATARIKLDD
ncbi:Bug family tripartite tricarboxylate transporter substrate binding protein [Variovorax saccharolyticus]|uniref:Bug family tripartite tricarboxylate transporter substrate binding protein n=1 Tax=Variovorax saccharolyticus TaxID=3053516 RepID=UPI0025762223|nr:tripartite tricarboxylate transporter substrate binding protein [Variovorax sp. J31P216]MDM0026669.1 tripartite tricarboxylate transporter substrate binding protein [Variovorax sp. J31P216]